MVFSDVPASEPRTPWSANSASAAAVSSRLQPASDAWALHWLMACVRSETSAEDALAAPASALAMRVASPAPRPKLPIICTVVAAASARLSCPAAARSMDAASAPPLMSASVMPPLASSTMALAASVALKTVSDPS